MRIETIGNASLYLGDCRDIAPSCVFSAIITDPPYGMDDWGPGWIRGNCGRGRLGGNQSWDERPEDSFLRSLIEYKLAIIWGGNYFSLPISKGWIVWDKDANMTQAQAELAWSNVVPNVRVIKLSPLGVFGNYGKNGEIKEHPAQKPIRLMSWCVAQMAKDSVIFDPYMGSGSTGVAAVKSGCKFVGIEKEVRYFDISCRRIDEATRQPDIFIKSDPIASTIPELLL